MEIFCSCGKPAVVRTSWTDTNPGRRYWGCPVQYSKCPFIGWVDHPMCPRAKAVIPGLLRSMNRLQATIDLLKEEKTTSKKMKKLKKEAGKGKIVGTCSWVFFGILFGILLVFVILVLDMCKWLV